MSIGEDNEVSQPRRARPRKGRRLFWLVFNVGLLGLLCTGIYRARHITLSSLMDNATWVAPFDKYSSYRWTSDHEMTLYQYRRVGLEVFLWDTGTRRITLLEIKKKGNIEDFEKSPHILFISTKNEVMTIRGWIKSPGSNSNKIAIGANTPNADYTWKLRIREGVNPDWQSCVTSPDGKCVAYIARMQRPNPLAQLLVRFKFIHLPKPETGVGIIVNDADGKNARLVGFTETEMPKSHGKFSKSGKTASLQRLQWRPDGRKLSFAYGDGIYTVPVND